ncbi:MAG TPA: hypothetical protein VLB84_05210, partial [Bacteroidia bacterium]|nr:hypothetical protein [Bacteroidia bacterium]
MKKVRLTILCLCYSFLVQAQVCPKHYIEAQYKKQYYPERSDELSQQYALIGMYKQALIEEEKNNVLYSANLNNPKTNLQSRNAYPYIYDAIKKNDVIILNECHNIPLNRTIFYNIIDSLKSSGIKSVFLETLGYVINDSVWSATNDIEDWGVYTEENVFRQAALKLQRNGIKLYSYEKSFNDLDTASIGNKKYIISKKDSSWVPVEADEYIISQFFKDDYYNREAQQGIKIFEKMKRNHITKAFIYCGYSHAWKSGGHMADILQHLLSKNVYVIDQMILNERVNKKLEDPLYSKFATTDYPFVILDETKRPLHGIFLSDRGVISEKIVDLVVGSPKSVYVRNRPTWLELNGLRKRYALSKFMDVSKD